MFTLVLQLFLIFGVFTTKRPNYGAVDGTRSEQHRQFILLESHPFVRLPGALNVTFAISSNVINAPSLVKIPDFRAVNFFAYLAAFQRDVEDFAQFV